MPTLVDAGLMRLDEAFGTSPSVDRLLVHLPDRAAIAVTVGGRPLPPPAP